MFVVIVIVFVVAYLAYLILPVRYNSKNCCKCSDGANTLEQLVLQNSEDYEMDDDSESDISQ